MKRVLVALLFLLPLDEALSQFDTMYVILRGDTTEVWQKTTQNCASMFTATATLSNDSVIVVETDTSTLSAFCDCYFTMRTSLVGLPAGSYHAVIFLRFLKQYHPWLPKDSVKFYGSIDFIVTGHAAPTLAQHFRQSECNGSLVEVKSESRSMQAADLQLSIFPNPFNPETTFEYAIPYACHVTLEIFDILGRRIAGLVDGYQSAGIHRVRFSASGISSGIYVGTLRARDHVTTRRFISVR